jgi:hypothetical protein
MNMDTMMRLHPTDPDPEVLDYLMDEFSFRLIDSPGNPSSRMLIAVIEDHPDGCYCLLGNWHGSVDAYFGVNSDQHSTYYDYTHIMPDNNLNRSHP